jgi:hypothetical protein
MNRCGLEQTGGLGCPLAFSSTVNIQTISQEVFVCNWFLRQLCGMNKQRDRSKTETCSVHQTINQKSCSVWKLQQNYTSTGRSSLVA